MKERLKQYIIKPQRFNYLNKWLSKPSVKILDVGCGNHSPSLTKDFFPNCKYYGIDKSKSYKLNKADFNSMEKFYHFDISNVSNFKAITNEYFDCIILSHIIEHIENGEEIILLLLKKLKKKGVIYIEFPSSHSVNLPSMKGTLNFYDDPEHIKLYHLNELKQLLTYNGCIIIKSGIRQSLKKILLIPVFIINSYVKYRYVPANVFWDITGFASYIVALKI